MTCWRAPSGSIRDTKNGEGRTVTLPEACYLLVVELMRGERPEDFLLTLASVEPVGDFRAVWAALVKAAGVPGLLFHDLRCSAVRNMVRRGATERVAMRISGHKSRSVVGYDIVSESDLADAALKVERGGKAELHRARVIHSSYIEPAKSEADSREENARKPS